MRRQNNTIDLQKLKEELDDLNNKINDKWESYSCTLVTPMYGGGVKEGKVDTAMPIRASAIRGQLRFWWRIACGPKDPKELFEKETEIWGGIGGDGATASQVEIRVQSKPALDKDFVKSNKYYEGIKYVFGSASINGAVDWLKDGYKFTLFVRCDDVVKNDVEEALRWWSSFGGIGSRTRRGFGAVSIENVELIDNDHDVFKRTDAESPRLVFFHNTYSSASEAWRYAADKLFEFRQKAGFGRNNSSGKTGRSFWPEPDALRRLTETDADGKHIPKHKAGNIFARAAFGMPITLKLTGKGEPEKTDLKPINSERMASPLILRPYGHDKEWKAAALLLPKWQEALTEELELSPKPKKQNGPLQNWPTDKVSRREAAQEITPMKDNGKLRADDPEHGPDPLSAFLDYFKQGQ
ncbi:type III-B CRISPR module RAMP protein Cmr1 [Vibrio metschnikovii]|uniref:type III-B CRISPR module RAMP protein Cmr1 n=1 Tax=Vibrio metschnikovii TaxID=28172 RepID=UPI00165DBBF5|nr:type III-B CRISPR module RAMP protein Cmr1 [Vibrio metschnikovii]